MQRTFGLWAIVLATILIEHGASMAAGAVAVGQGDRNDVSIGMSGNYTTTDEAKAIALEHCKQNGGAISQRRCKIVATFTNQCVAEAMDPKAGTPGFGWALANNSKDAENQAMTRCRDKAGPSRQNACTAKVTCDGTASVADDKDRPICFSLSNENYRDNTKFDVGLNACSSMINSGRYKDKTLASIYRARGSWNQKRGDLDASLADYGISIRIDPNNVESYDYRADVFQQKGDLDSALADYDQASRINPTYAAAYYSRGLIYEKKGDLDKARMEYNAAIAVPTIDRVAKWAQDNAREKLQALADPADYDQAIRLNSNDAQAFKGRGLAYQRKKDYARAALDFDEVTRINPRDADAWSSRCWSRAIAGQLEQALKDCNESLQLRPNDQGTIDSRGLVHLKLGQFDAAIADDDDVLKFNSKMAASLYVRGIAKLNKGDKAGGIADIAAAKAAQADIAEKYAGYGVTPP